MSDDIQKADQIAHHLYTKLAAVVHDGRTLPEPEPGRPPKTEKWFNLELTDPGTFKEFTNLYRAVSLGTTPPFELQVLLVVPELGNNQALVYRAPDSSRVRVEPTPRHVLLESWVISFAQTTSTVQPATMYKHGISLFRSIFTLLRLLPAWTLLRKYRRRTGQLALQLRAVRSGSDPDVLAFGARPAPGVAPLQTSVHAFPAVPHPNGTLTVSVTYLSTPSFQIDELESLLSSRFLSLDEGPEFTPTLSVRPRDGNSGNSGGAGDVSTSRSPPRSAAAIAERFVLPPAGQPHRRTTSFSAQSTRTGLVGAPPGTSPSAASMVSNSSRGSGAESTSLISARIRRESATGRTGGGLELPSAPTQNPLPIKRPPTTLPLFKTSALSSGSPSVHSGSPSLRHMSPLSTGVGPAPSQPSPASPSGRVPPSPITTQGLPSSIGRPSLPSSLGEPGLKGRSPSVDSPRIPATKRYSSTFGASRQSAGAAAAAAVAAAAAGTSTPLAASEPPSAVSPIATRAVGTSFMSTGTDDDDISLFVKDIDARTPLRGHQRGHSLPFPPNRPLSAPSAPASSTFTRGESPTGQDHDRDLTLRLTGPGLGRSGSAGSAQQRRAPSGLGPTRPSRISEVTETSTTSDAPSTASVDTASGANSTATAPAGAMLTNPADVDARWREMNETFMASLAGLGRAGPSSSSALHPPRGESPSLSGMRTPATEGSNSTGGGSSTRLTRDASGRASSIGSQEVLGKLDLSGRKD